MPAGENMKCQGHIPTRTSRLKTSAVKNYMISIYYRNSETFVTQPRLKWQNSF